MPYPPVQPQQLVVDGAVRPQPRSSHCRLELEQLCITRGQRQVGFAHQDMLSHGRLRSRLLQDRVAAGLTQPWGRGSVCYPPMSLDIIFIIGNCVCAAQGSISELRRGQGCLVRAGSPGVPVWPTICS